MHPLAVSSQRHRKTDNWGVSFSTAARHHLSLEKAGITGRSASGLGGAADLDVLGEGQQLIRLETFLADFSFCLDSPLVPVTEAHARMERASEQLYFLAFVFLLVFQSPGKTPPPLARSATSGEDTNKPTQTWLDPGRANTQTPHAFTTGQGVLSTTGGSCFCRFLLFGPSFPIVYSFGPVVAFKQEDRSNAPARQRTETETWLFFSVLLFRSWDRILGHTTA